MEEGIILTQKKSPASIKQKKINEKNTFRKDRTNSINRRRKQFILIFPPLEIRSISLLLGIEYWGMYIVRLVF